MKLNEGSERVAHSQLEMGEGKGKSLCPPQFKLVASGDDPPIQRKKVQIDKSTTIETKNYTKSELESLQVQMLLDNKEDVAKEIQSALEKGEFDQSGGEEVYNEFVDAMHNDKDLSEDEKDDEDYLELLVKAENKDLLLPGIKFAQEKSKERKDKQPMPLNSIKGNMFEMSFDKMRENEDITNISANEHLMNCPGIDHISPFGNYMFEQSKNYTTGNLEEITNMYEDTFSKSAKMGELLFNKGSGTKETGKKIRGMFGKVKDNEGFDEEQQQFNSNIFDKMEKFAMDEEENPFDESEENVKSFQEKFYMQVPNDVFMNLMKKGNENLDQFYPNDLTTENMKEFEDYCVNNKFALRPKEIKEQKSKNEDTDYNSEEEKNRKKKKVKKE